MSAADIAQTIQLIIAPVVLITACMIFQNGILVRYGSIGQRIRSLTHERFELLQPSRAEDILNLERLREIDRQLPLLVRRHRLIQKSALLSYVAITIFITTMFVIALSVGLNAGIIGTFALVLFLVGTAVLLIGTSFAALEIRISHLAICYEVHDITSLKKR